MEEFKLLVATKLNAQGVTERMVTVRADTLEEARSLYRRIMADLPNWDGSQNGHQAAQKGPQAPRVEGSPSVSPSLVCPQHGKAKEGKFGPYCPTKMLDGSWCQWRHNGKAPGTA